MQSPLISHELNKLYDAIFTVLNPGVIWDWAQQSVVAYLLPVANEADIEQDEWLKFHLRPALYAYTIQFGVEKLLKELIEARKSPQSPDLIRSLAENWLTRNEVDDLDEYLGTEECTSQTLLKFKPIISEIFQVNNYGIEKLQGNAAYLEQIAVRYERNPSKPLTPGNIRNLSLDFSAELEAMLKLMLVFYKTIFIAHNSEFGRVFDDTIKGNMSFSNCLTAIGTIENIFKLGETRNGENRRRTKMQKEIEQEEVNLTNIELEKRRQIEGLYQEKSRLEGKCRELLRKITSGVTKDLAEKYEEQLDELEDRDIRNIDDEIHNIETEIEQAKFEIDSRIVEIKNQFERDSRAYQELAYKLQTACDRLFGRETPFFEFYTKRIEEFKDRFRNPYAHMTADEIDRVIHKNGTKEIRQLSQNITDIISFFTKTNHFPRTFVVLGKVTDVSGGAVLMLCRLTYYAQNSPFWSNENVKWVYRWQDVNEYQKVNVGDAFFMIPQNEEKVLFEPVMIKCGELIDQLRPLLPESSILQ